MEDRYLQLLLSLHRGGRRQGPGGDAETRRALKLAGLERNRRLKVADLGCGTGASTLVLAKGLNADITAVDFLDGFLAELRERAKTEGVAECITLLNCSINELPFDEQEFDVIWSEGAIYNIGFRHGVSSWKRYLKPGGKLVVSDITWITDDRPSEIEEYWKAEFPEIDTTPSKIRTLMQSGYRYIDHFILAPNCWLQNFYDPLSARFEDFLSESKHSDAARKIVEQHEDEILMYRTFQDYFSYGVYVAEKDLDG